MPLPLLTLAGQTWAPQCGAPDAIAITENGDVRFRAASRTAAPFENSASVGDIPRKVRAELCGQRRYAKGEVIRLRGSLRYDPGTVIAGADWCSCIQIHQADTRRADGNFVAASPLFSVDVLPDGKGGHSLRVRGETGTGPQPSFSPLRVLGSPVPFVLGRSYAYDLLAIDDHGGPNGRITFLLDGKPICDFRGPTGYEYVDLFAGAWKRPDGSVIAQLTGAYLKLGIYTGKGDGIAPPPGLSVALTMSGLSA